MSELAADFLAGVPLFAGRDEFFADSNHLNTAGRVALSRRLHQELASAGIVP